MTCESQVGRLQSDTMPFSEARREATELVLSVGMGRFVGVADSEGNNFASIRVKGTEKVYARECHDGYESIIGNVRLPKGESYDVAFDGGIVKFEAAGRVGLSTVIKVQAPEGMTVQTGK